jgi:hypothetical protein
VYEQLFFRGRWTVKRWFRFIDENDALPPPPSSPTRRDHVNLVMKDSAAMI